MGFLLEAEGNVSLGAVLVRETNVATKVIPGTAEVITADADGIFKVKELSSELQRRCAEVFLHDSCGI